MRRALIAIVALSVAAAASAQSHNAQTAALGQRIFNDVRLSANGNQSCASCHDPRAGWTGPDSAVNAGLAVYEGSVAGRFGNRKPPTSAYASLSPILTLVTPAAPGVPYFVGGNFWDGRATGEVLGNPAADQAQGPFLNPLEHALTAPSEVVLRVCGGPYGRLFRHVWGVAACRPENVGVAWDAVAVSIAAFESSPRSNAFTSKYDHYLKGRTSLGRDEMRGLTLFGGKAGCARCHGLAGHDGMPPLLTDFRYANLGLPRNPQNPFYAEPGVNPLGVEWVDEGLGGFLRSRPEWTALADANRGRHKVPTLRNVDKRRAATFVKAYGHNGYFKSLEATVHFMNTRDARPACADRFTTAAEALAADCWPEPEIGENTSTAVGDLGLTPGDEAALVAFLRTLTDGYRSSNARP